MSLQYAILGILNIMPMSGYDLKHDAFDATVRHFWPADQSQIYRTLGRLAERGWVSMTVEAQDERPDRKVYAITPAGKAALMAWLQEPQPPPTLRDPFLVQLFFGQEQSNAELAALIAAQAAQHGARLAALEAIPIPPASSRPADRWLALQHLTRDFGIALERAYVDWLQQCAATVAALPDLDEAADFRAIFAAPPPAPET